MELRDCLRRSSVAVLVSAFSLLLTGCTLSTTAPEAPTAGAALRGSVYGGQQPVSGSRVYLMAATVSGVGSAGYGLASKYLLNGNVFFSNPTNSGLDANGNYYVTSNSAGGFSITGDYTCTANQQLYLYAIGGNPGVGTNSAAGFLAALGSCSGLSSSMLIQVNELTTVAAAYSLAGFATDALHISIPQYVTGTTADTLAQNGLQNAFATAANLVSTATGYALTTTPGGNGTPTTAQVNTLGNILASCINSAGPSSAACTTLLGNAGSTGGATGTLPTDTATAAINLAHYPYVSDTVMGNLYALQTAAGSPFLNGDTSQPTDFTVSINYFGGGLSTPFGIAIDGSGSPWVTSIGANRISKFSSSGTAISSGSGYTGGGLNEPRGIAIDGLGNAWVANSGGNHISEFSSSGTAISPNTGYTGGGLSGYGSLGIAIDGSSNAWVTNGEGNSISEFSSSGTAISSSSGYTGGGLNDPFGIAIDGSGNAWVSNNSTNNVISKFSSSGTALSGSNGYNGGGLNHPYSIAIDGSGNAWVANGGGNSISEFSSTGKALSPSSGYSGSVLNVPVGIAIDGSGNVWAANNNINAITELIGAATPVVTPLVANLISPYSAPASKP